MAKLRSGCDLMGANDQWAARRALLAERRITMLNLIGSPAREDATARAHGRAAGGRLRFAVLEGDVETTRDAERSRGWAVA
jgi:hypothetical protein